MARPRTVVDRSTHGQIQNPGGVTLAEGTSEIAVTRTRGLDVSIRLVANRPDGQTDGWADGLRQPVEFIAHADRNMYEWRATRGAVHIERTFREQQHVGLQIFVDELVETQFAQLKHQLKPALHMVAVLSPGRHLPVYRVAHGRLPGEPDSSTTSVELSELHGSPLLVRSSYGSISRTRTGDFSFTGDAIVSWTADREFETESRTDMTQWFARAATDAARTISFMSAEHVSVLQIETLYQAGGDISIKKVYRNVQPPAPRERGHWTLPPGDFPTAASAVYGWLSARQDGHEATHAAINEYANMCSVADVRDRIRHGALALDLLSSQFGEPHECSESDRRRYQALMLGALKNGSAPHSIHDHVKENLGSVFKQSFRRRIETMLSRYGVPSEDMFPNGFAGFVKVRNSLQHNGTISEDAAAVEKWQTLAPRLSILLARTVLSICGAPQRRGSFTIWDANADPPAGW